MKKNILLDTNFILEIVKSTIDLFDEIRFLLGPVRFIIIPGVLIELENIMPDILPVVEKKVLPRCEIVEWREGFDVDEGLILFAKKYPNTYVATIDRKLCKRLKKEKIPVIRLRNGRPFIF